MTYWRMQLHPADSRASMRHAVESVAAGFIGLDFKSDPGDLLRVRRPDLPEGQRDYWDFAHSMGVRDRVLVIVHHFPFALVTVAGSYNYVKAPEPEIGVWFRHFRRIDRRKTRYYADRLTNVRQWSQLRMTDALSSLRPGSRSYQVIRSWR